MKFISQLRHVLFQVGVPLFLVTLLGSTLDHWITMKMEMVLMNTDGTDPMLWVYGLASLVLGLTYPLFNLILVLSSLQDMSFGSFFQRNFIQNLIEMMRAWGRSFLWSFLFILPGLYRYIQFLLIPFVVCFDPAYQRGERDALKTAIAKSKGYWGRLFFVFVIFSLVLPILMTGFDEWKIVWQTPLSAILICLVEMLFNVCFILILWKIYQRSGNHESSFSMEGHPNAGSRPHI